MNWYVYKCNSKRNVGPYSEDWRRFFDSVANSKDGTASWGSDEFVDIGRLRPGDAILAYATDSNSLIGHLTVVRWDRDENGLYESVYLRPKLRLGHDGVKVRPMKKIDEKIAEIDAFKTGRIMTLCDITPAEAKYLLKVAKKRCPQSDITRWE